MANGWGGDLKTKKPSVKTLRKAKKVLSILEACHMPWPSVTAVASGSLLLSWISLTRSVIMTVDQVGDIQFISSITKRDPHTMEILDSMQSEGHVHDMKTVDNMMAWYCSDHSGNA